MSTPLHSLCVRSQLILASLAHVHCRTIVINSVKIAPNYTPLLIAASSSLPVSSCHNRNTQKRAPNCVISPIFIFFARTLSVREMKPEQTKGQPQNKKFYSCHLDLPWGESTGGRKRKKELIFEKRVKNRN